MEYEDITLKEIEEINNNSELEEIKERTKALENNMKNLWGHSALGVEAKKAAMTMLSTKTGMYAKVPLICKAESCPYVKTCKMSEFGLAPQGEPCPVETALIELSYSGYEKDFELDEEISSFTDRILVKELITVDVMIERVKALLTEQGVMTEDVVAGIAESGEVYYRPEVSKNLEVYDRLQNRRDKYYNLMLATRKDKVKEKGDGQVDSMSNVVNQILNEGYEFKIEQKPENIIDLEPNNQ